MNKIFKIFLVFCVLFVTVSLISCSNSSSGSDDGGSTTVDSSSPESSDSTTKTSDKYFYVAVTHSGKSGYEILYKKAKVNGVEVGSNGKNKSSYKQISGSGSLHYACYENTKKGGTTRYNNPTGSGNYNFKHGKKYTINCANGSISEG